MFPDVSHKKGVLKKFAEFTGKHVCPCFFFKKVASLKQSSLEYSPTFEWNWESSLCPLLRKKCPYSELFWSTFSRIRTEYGEICISSYLVRMRENADQNNFKYRRFSCSVLNASPNLPNNMIVSVICTSIFLFSSASFLQFLSNIKSISSSSPFMLEKLHHELTMLDYLMT